MRTLQSSLLVSLLTLSLVSCASVPQQGQLMAGIDASKISQGSATKLTPSDPTCVNFYNNVNEFQRQAQKSQGSKNFVSSLGLNVLVSVATAGLIPPGVGTVGRAAAVSATSSVTSQGGRIAMRELNSSNRADAKIIESAALIGCPVALSP